MVINERNKLKKDDQIILYNHLESKNESVFTINEVEGEGGFCVCYKASLNDGSVNKKVGRLKEYYPSEIICFLNRNEENHYLSSLVSPIQIRFMEDCQTYANKYITLNEISQSDDGLHPFNSFIPNAYIYYAKEDNELKGVYVWTPMDSSGMTYEDYLSQIHQKENDEETLNFIVRCMITLCKDILSLHHHDYIHLDIKPKNFLIEKDASQQLNPETLSLFDIDSFQNINQDNMKGEFYSPGFSAMEIRTSPSKLCDIYSIGATFFYSLSYQLYHNERDFKNISAIIKNSKILKDSEFDDDPKVLTKIVKILQHTLRISTLRYQTLEELQYEFEDLLQLIKTRKNNINEKDGYDVDTALMNVLYKYPFYEKAEDHQINILVCGAGEIGCKFIDYVLQLAMMPNYQINIDVYSKDIKEDYQTYCELRKELSKVISINDSLPSSNVHLQFHVKKPFTFNEKVKKNVKSILKKPYHYVFIALGNDALNRELYAMIKKELPHTNIFYIIENKRRKNEKQAIYAQNNQMMNEELLRMAFNTHLTWSGSHITSLKEEYKNFCKDYNRYSSIMFAISLRYKLKSFNIEWDDMHQLAKQFNAMKQSQDIKDQEMINDLVWCEHQRWIIEKTTAGWKIPEDFDEYVTWCIKEASVKDNYRCIHPCIVTSERRLSSPYMINKNKEYWNEGNEYLELDLLDQVSIRLHRAFLKDAKEKQKQREILEKILKEMSYEIILENQDIKEKFIQYRYAIQCIMDQNQYYSQKFSQIEETLKNTMEALDHKHFLQQMNEVKRFLFTTIESNLYHDYKENDRKFIAQIPFILTYHPSMEEKQSSICLAFQDGTNVQDENELLFSNVASATLLKPSKIYYHYYLKEDCDIPYFKKIMQGMFAYYKNNTSIHFTIYYKEELSKAQKLNMKQIHSLFTQRDDTLILQQCDNEEDMIKDIEQTIQQYHIDFVDGSTLFFIDDVYYQKQYQEMLQKYRYFEFDWHQQEFMQCIGCDELRYIYHKQQLRVEDMLLLMNEHQGEYRLPEFESEYQQLWKIYSKILDETSLSESILNFYHLCDVVQMHIVKENITLIETSETSNHREMMLLPDYVSLGAKRLLQQLIDHQLVNEQSKLLQRNAQTWCLELISNDTYDISEMIDIFSMYHHLANPNGIQVLPKEHTYMVQFDTLEVKDMPYDASQKKILDAFYDLHFIYYRDVSANSCSFVMGSYPIKRLFMCGSEILKLYIYYEARKCGYFDDIVYGYQCKLHEDRQPNEIDCILTKGFSSLFIECEKPHLNMDEVYDKLDAYADYFGIHEKKIVIAPVYHKEDEVMMEQNKNRQKNVITIYRKEDIEQIGEILISIMEEDFQKASKS